MLLGYVNTCSPPTHYTLASQFEALLSSLKLVYPTLATQSHVHRAELRMCNVISEQWGRELTPPSAHYHLPQLCWLESAGQNRSIVPRRLTVPVPGSSF